MKCILHSIILTFIFSLTTIVAGAQNVGIGTTTPTALFSVGAGSTSPFQVNSSGAIAAATGITSSGAITFSGLNTAGGIVYTNGSGTFASLAGTSGKVLTSGGAGAPVWNTMVTAANGVFILNQTGQQSSSNFNISGAGVIGTTLSVGSNLTVTGITKTQSFQGKVRSVTTDVTLDNTDYFVIITSGSNRTVTLPSPAAVGAGHTIIIRGMLPSSKTLTASYGSSHIIDKGGTSTSSSVSLDSNSGAAFISDGTDWYRIY